MSTKFLAPTKRAISVASILLTGVLTLSASAVCAENGASNVAQHLAVVAKAREHALKTATPAERELIEQDLLFGEDSAKRSVAIAFAERVLPDGMLIGYDSPIAVGPEGIKAELSGVRSKWYWSPKAARVDGDLGVTWGVAAIVYQDKQGEEQSFQTRYVTVWSRNAQGQWKIWIDIGNQGPAD